MYLQLTYEQSQALNTPHGEPMRLVDSATGQVYVLVPEAVATALLGDLAETYPAQIESAMRAGWEDPEMDAYNEYDKHRPA